MTCVEAKMTVDPYKGIPKRHQDPGALTHIDVWGKYEVASINGHQYYIIFVDDNTRYMTINFLKTHKKNPQAIRVDRGTEFLNDPIKVWCREHGIEIQTMVPYSPEFLWELAAEHAAYLRNRAYMKSLREFGAPVWVLLQGQKEPRKILPKSTSRTFVGFEDSPPGIIVSLTLQ